MASMPHHPTSANAVQLLALSIRAARKQRRWTIAELASRAGVDRSTVMRIEKGDPGVAIGTYFDTAALTGVPLYSPDVRDVSAETWRVGQQLALLPSRIDSPRGRTNDF